MWGCPCMVCTLPLFTAFLAVLLSETGGCHNYVLPFPFCEQIKIWGEYCGKLHSLCLFLQSQKTKHLFECNASTTYGVRGCQTVVMLNLRRCGQRLQTFHPLTNLFVSFPRQATDESYMPEHFQHLFHQMPMKDLTQSIVRTAKPNINCIVVCRPFQNLSIGG